MSSQKYERVIGYATQAPHIKKQPDANWVFLQVSAHDQDDVLESPRERSSIEHNHPSPPPSFHSRTSSLSSRRLLSSDDPLASEAERHLADTFDDGSDSDDDVNNNGDDRQRLMRTNTILSERGHGLVHDGNRPDLSSRLPGTDAPPPTINVPTRPYPPFPTSRGIVNDGVFANLNAKPERGEKLEEQPPVRDLSH